MNSASGLEFAFAFANLSAGIDTHPSDWQARGLGPCYQCYVILQKKGTSLSDRRPVYKVFPRDKTVKNGEGDVIRTEEWKETVPVVRNTIRVDCTCSNCGRDSYYTEVSDEDPEEA